MMADNLIVDDHDVRGAPAGVHAPPADRVTARPLLTPIFCAGNDLTALDASQVVSVTRFADRYVAAPRSCHRLDANPYMSNQIAVPALAVNGTDATCEVRLAPQGTRVTYRRWLEPELGVVEESCFGDQRVVRLTLAEDDHATRGRDASRAERNLAPLRHAAYAGYTYLFGRQQRDQWRAVRYTNYVPGVIEVDSRYADASPRSEAGASDDGSYWAPVGQRYVSFNQGRFDAWAQSGPKRIAGAAAISFEPANGRRWRPVCPAATGIGAGHGDLVIEGWYTVCPDTRLQYIENGWQTPAFRYDTRYGPKPPVFARGTYVKTSTVAGVVVSGTASSRRSEIIHDPAQEATISQSALLETCLRKQLKVTIENIAYLLSGRNLRPQGVEGAFGLSDLVGVRVYLKHGEHAPQAQQELTALLPSHVPTIFLEDHVCRPGWLLEIEGMAWRAQLPDA
jgi:hypothetical protein